MSSLTYKISYLVYKISYIGYFIYSINLKVYTYLFVTIVYMAISHRFHKETDHSVHLFCDDLLRQALIVEIYLTTT